jgi:hypothetical protein
MLWDVELPVVGQCPACREDLSEKVLIRSTASWIKRYNDQHDYRLRSGINRAVEQWVMSRHARTCAARRRERQLSAASA